ncbi:lytic murein transglycosylase [Spiribacter vilamensis]|uniref:Membrane-bound lytic murein transglycosylase B n=1 Tax=Spiribacter vilamensis TaxID=531306 RepID=A0A4V2GJ13_9GAMM|nr:lytic murein transglycosylase [Spiribacter vilamensis]RZU98585.1 membrane-bound lytic murein transglycosylase B [Spiribacter vilamensis]TVO60158.1 lytic murein transglycosylase [Spiribacter vilamensis]
MSRSRKACLIIGLIAGIPATANAETDFGSCLDNLRDTALERDISAQTVDRLLSDITPSERVIELDRRQPEFTTTLHDYLAARVNRGRIKRGRELLREHADLLGRIEREYGVPARYLVAFWGLESNYGRTTGNMSTVRSLATLACDRRRGDFFRAELIDALHLVDDESLSAEQLRGSWAGALGNFQFLPSVYRRHTVDADGDGRTDLWESLPDAAESAANFLRARGWQPEERWGREVRLPEGFDYDLAETERSVTDWRRAGLRQANGDALPAADLTARLIIPAGAAGPAFLVYPNFDVIMRWNPSRFYALSVGRLADRLVGAPPLYNPPPDHPALHVDTIEALQTALNERGFDAGTADGRLGPQTRAAIRGFQTQQGMTRDGYPDPAVLNELGIDRQEG